MRGKTILVTGSAGFIGFHVSKKLLEAKNNVIGIDNFNDYYSISLKKKRNKILSGFESYYFHKVDINRQHSLEKIFQKHKIDNICHLAARVGIRSSLVNPLIYEKINVGGFLNILECARKFGIHNICYASSSSVYGKNLLPKDGFSEVDSVNRPISIYGATKRTDELIAYTYHHLYRLNCTGLRFFTVYGPWGRPDMAYFRFTKSILKGEQIELFNFGKMKRDFTYINDIVSGVISAIEKSYPYEIFNLGNSKAIELMYLVNCIERGVGKKAKIKFSSIQPGDLVKTYANISHSQKMLDYQPRTNIEDGINKFIRWYIKYFSKDQR